LVRLDACSNEGHGNINVVPTMDIPSTNSSDTGNGLSSIEEMNQVASFRDIYFWREFGRKLKGIELGNRVYINGYHYSYGLDNSLQEGLENLILKSEELSPSNEKQC
jgi:hypothetical protein